LSSTQVLDGGSPAADEGQRHEVHDPLLLGPGHRTQADALQGPSGSSGREVRAPHHTPRCARCARCARRAHSDEEQGGGGHEGMAHAHTSAACGPCPPPQVLDGQADRAEGRRAGAKRARATQAAAATIRQAPVQQQRQPAASPPLTQARGGGDRAAEAAGQRPVVPDEGGQQGHGRSPAEPGTRARAKAPKVSGSHSGLGPGRPAKRQKTGEGAGAGGEEVRRLRWARGVCVCAYNCSPHR
jgi:hypothetical protein